MLKCKTFKPMFSYMEPKDVLIFGRIARIKKSAPADYTMQCMAIDDNGTTYRIYTDYDACITLSDAIAVPVTK